MDKEKNRLGAGMGLGDTPRPRMDMAPEGSCGCESDGERPGMGGSGDSTCPPTPPCQGHEGCPEGSWGLSGYPLAMVYAPCQYFRGVYDPATALKRGTLFEELDLPLEVALGASCPLARHG